MISATLEFTGQILDDHLKSHFGLNESKVVLNSPVSADGTIPPGNMNKVLLSLINLDRAATKAPISFGYKAATTQPADDVKTGNYTLYILASTNFDSYTEALKFLDALILFFSEHTLLERAVYPNLPNAVSKIEVTLEPADGVHMRSIWLALGARYQPSVIYKLVVTAAQ